MKFNDGDRIRQCISRNEYKILECSANYYIVENDEEDIYAWPIELTDSCYELIK